jgi:hypothetical protein
MEISLGKLEYKHNKSLQGLLSEKGLQLARCATCFLQSGSICRELLELAGCTPEYRILDSAIENIFSHARPHFKFQVDFKESVGLPPSKSNFDKCIRDWDSACNLVSTLLTSKISNVHSAIKILCKFGSIGCSGSQLEVLHKNPSASDARQLFETTLQESCEALSRIRSMKNARILKQLGLLVIQQSTNSNSLQRELNFEKSITTVFHDFECARDRVLSRILHHQAQDQIIPSLGALHFFLNLQSFSAHRKF